MKNKKVSSRVMVSKILEKQPQSRAQYSFMGRTLYAGTEPKRKKQLTGVELQKLQEKITAGGGFTNAKYAGGYLLLGGAVPPKARPKQLTEKEARRLTENIKYGGGYNTKFRGRDVLVEGAVPPTQRKFMPTAQEAAYLRIPGSVAPKPKSEYTTRKVIVAVGKGKNQHFEERLITTKKERGMTTAEEQALSYKLRNPKSAKLQAIESRAREVYQKYAGGLSAKKAYETAFKRGDETKYIKQRERAVKGGLTAMGIIAGKQTYAGAGRPRGTYKYGMPIQVYKQKLRQERALYEQFQQEQMGKLGQQGFTPEQIQQLQQQQTIQELEQPSVPQAVQQLQRLQMLKQAQQGQMPQEIYPQEIQQNQNVMRQRYAQDEPYHNPSDDELEFTRWRAEKTVSPNTQRLMNEVRRIQLLGKTSVIEQARRNRERKMLSNQMNLMKAHENMSDVRVDFTGVPEDNILFAPSVFKENPENNILKPRGTSILKTHESGNDLNFW